MTSVPVGVGGWQHSALAVSNRTSAVTPARRAFSRAIETASASMSEPTMENGRDGNSPRRSSASTVSSSERS